MQRFIYALRHSVDTIVCMTMRATVHRLYSAVTALSSAAQQLSFDSNRVTRDVVGGRSGAMHFYTKLAGGISLQHFRAANVGYVIDSRVGWC